MSKKDFTTTCTGSNYTFYENTCKHRLPCGVCELTNQKCPLCWQPWSPYQPWSPNQPYITWSTTTVGDSKIETINTNDFRRKSK